MSEAAYWASTVSASDFRRQPQSLDLAALEEVPAWRDRVVALVDQYDVAAYRVQQTLEADVAAADPERARIVVPSAGATLIGLVALFTPMVAFALIFSRARLELEGTAPWFAGLLLVAAIAAAVRVLPIRRGSPPSKGQLFFAIVPAVLGILAFAGVAFRIALQGGSDAPPVWWVLGAVAVAVCAALALAAMVARATAPADLVGRRDSAVAEWRDRVRAARAAVTAEWVERLHREWDALPRDERAAVSAGLHDACRVLAERRIIESADAAAEHLPGLLMIESRVRELTDGERLDPTLSALPRTR